METDLPLLTTLAVGLTAAFVFGFIACKIGLSPIVGYMLAGLLIGPSTPGFVADPAIAQELAEIGVLLLMFGVGLHFSLRDLLSVKHIAIPGAIVQIIVATTIGALASMAWGWSFPTALLFGLSLSVASTVLILREFKDAKLLDTQSGRIAVGWLIVEDLVMIIVLVLIPVMSIKSANNTLTIPPAEVWVPQVLIALLKVAAFVAFMLVLGGRLMTGALHLILHTGSRELFTLSVFAIAIGISYAAAKLFNVSFALGAFFAGMMLRESTLSNEIAKKAQPFQDVFTAMFFVSVGMLFNPMVLIDAPLKTLATILIIFIGNALTAYCILTVFRFPKSSALLVAASLAQIGEFSFILANIGYHTGILPEEGYGLILAAALITMILNPFLFEWVRKSSEKSTKLTA